MPTTILWPTGVTGHPYGSFAGKAEAAPVVDTGPPRQSYAAIYRRTGRHGWILVFLYEGLRWLRGLA